MIIFSAFILLTKQKMSILSVSFTITFAVHCRLTLFFKINCSVLSFFKIFKTKFSTREKNFTGVPKIKLYIKIFELGFVQRPPPPMGWRVKRLIKHTAGLRKDQINCKNEDGCGTKISDICSLISSFFSLMHFLSQQEFFSLQICRIINFTQL